MCYLLCIRHCGNTGDVAVNVASVVPAATDLRI